MEVVRGRITMSTVQTATDFALRHGEDVVEKALNYLKDPDRKKRQEEGECKVCYYIRTSRIGGNALTWRNCAICGEEMNFNNTHTDLVCNKCAREHEICAHCGADLHLRPRRKFDESVVVQK